MQTVIKQQLFNKLAEVQDLRWAAELGIALRTLTDNVDYYVD